jgi:transposase
VQLCVEESFPVERVAREMGVGRSTLSKWVRLYRDQGEAGLQSKSVRWNRPRPKVAPAVKTQVIELKRRHPEIGIKKISQILRRMLFLPVSQETVRRTLHEQQLLKPPRRRPHHEDFHALGREIENLGELLMNLAVHPHGGPASHLDHDFPGFGFQLAQGLQGECPNHFQCDWSADVNPVTLLAGPAEFPLSGVKLRLAGGDVTHVAKGP